MKYQVFMTKWNKFSDAVMVVSMTPSEKKQISRLSPHPRRLFYFTAAQWTGILFSGVASPFCRALLPPGTRVPRVPECPGGAWRCYPAQETQGQQSAGQRDKAPLKCRICHCLTFNCLEFSICELIFHSHFSPSMLQFLSTVNLSFSWDV